MRKVCETVTNITVGRYNDLVSCMAWQMLIDNWVNWRLESEWKEFFLRLQMHYRNQDTLFRAGRRLLKPLLVVHLHRVLIRNLDQARRIVNLKHK